MEVCSFFHYSLLRPWLPSVCSLASLVVAFAGLPLGSIIPPLAGAALLAVGVLGPVFIWGPRLHLLLKGGHQESMCLHCLGHEALQGEVNALREDWLELNGPVFAAGSPLPAPRPFRPVPRGDGI